MSPFRETWAVGGLLGGAGLLVGFAWYLAATEPAPGSTNALIERVQESSDEPEILVPVLSEAPPRAPIRLEPLPNEVDNNPAQGLPRDVDGMPVNREVLLDPLPIVQAVQNGQDWIAVQQSSSGAWAFVAAEPEQQDDSHDARRAATALAVLALLAQEPPHRSPHWDRVARGMAWLKDQPGGDDRLAQAWTALAWGRFYQASAALPSRKQPAQDASDRLQTMQNVDGGWGRRAGDPAECLITAWSIEALHAAHSQYLKVDNKEVTRAVRFLDRVESHQGARFGSTQPGDGDEACTAAGLMSRVYMGRKRVDVGFSAGLDALFQQGPSAEDYVYTYFGSRAAQQTGGREWSAWRSARGRVALGSQERGGTFSAQRGSWLTPGGRWNAWGGRLLETSLRVMLLGMATDQQVEMQRMRREPDDF